MLQELTFKGIALVRKRTFIVRSKKSYAIRLQDGTNNILSIYVSEEQARSIIRETMFEDKPKRPLTHDLFANFLTSWSMEVKKVVINSVNENDVYIASLIVKQGDTTKEIDCRPSDAIALSVRLNCPIFAKSALITNSSVAA